jgi:hypothetical protein
MRRPREGEVVPLNGRRGYARKGRLRKLPQEASQGGKVVPLNGRRVRTDEKAVSASFPALEAPEGGNSLLSCA